MERKSVRFQAEEMIKELDRLKQEEEERRRAEEKAASEARKISEEKSAKDSEAEAAKKKAAEETKENPKKAIPRPPPLPTCWPPQVVDGKNVGGDAPGGGAAFGIPSGGGGRGGLLGALMGGRGGGGPLAFIRRKSVKPAVPKLKQLHWDTLDSTEGTLWAENPTKIGMVCVSPFFSPHLTLTALTDHP
jgi:hypothetical protein